MPVSKDIHRATIKELWLDPSNPRLGSEPAVSERTQESLLETMRHWELEELAASFLESGFWLQESLLVVKEKLDGELRLVVVEGNRRLAALKYLKLATEGKPATPKWRELVTGKNVDPKLFEEVPYLLADKRKDVRGYLGFRHVSGIKEWAPPEKAAFIAHMIEEDKLSYEQVMRRIGSKTETVRRLYIAHRTLQQMKENDERLDVSQVEDRFSVLFLALRGRGAQDYLGINITASPQEAKQPVPKLKLDALVRFTNWLFGNEKEGQKVRPVVKESRDSDRFDKVLASAPARDYMERTGIPDLSVAYKIAGGEEYEVFEELEMAAQHLRSALSLIHQHRKSARIETAVQHAARAAIELLRSYPDMRADILEEEAQFDRNASRKRH